jgi:SAM-dependent methyltransferase
VSAGTVPPAVVERIRRSRRHPRPTQFDYLHVKRLVDDLGAAITGLGEVRDVLDVYCGTRPYEDLFPTGAQVVGLDVDRSGYRYGVADVVSDDFLPFADGSFDAVMCTQAFHYIVEPQPAIAEIRRVLRPGGAVLITVPVVWEYDRENPEHHYTEPLLRRLFEGWDEVRVVENGGWGVSWAAVTATLLQHLEESAARRRILRPLARPLFAAAYLVVNGCGVALEAVDRRFVRGALRLPMNLLLTARRPT